MSDVILRVENLDKVFPISKERQVKAVRDISFEVQRGEIFGFLGPNGAGKSTTISMVTTQLEPTSGKIFIDEQSILEDPALARRKIGVVAQHERQNDYVRSYSGGMAQHLKIARAIMHNPDILFLDEPTTGLDPSYRSILWEQMLALNKAGTTIFLTTHYMNNSAIELLLLIRES